MRIRSLAVLAVAFALGSVLALLPEPLQAGEVAVDPPAAPPAPAPLAGPAAPVAPPVPPAAAPAPDAGPAPAPRFTREQLREIVGPIALYPDVVLSSLLPASAAPLDVVQAARWLAHRASPDEAPPTDRGWDPSVVALLQFPELVQWLDENLEWLEQLGAAMATQPGDVLAAIQEFREAARASGALASDEHQRVVTREVAPPAEAPAGAAPATLVCIEPADPQVVYVPVYDPVVVLEPVTVVEPVVAYPISWSFASWGPCAWHEFTWGWPCGGGWWGGGVWVHREPWHCGRPRHYVADAYGPSRWRPSPFFSRTYASRTLASAGLPPSGGAATAAGSGAVATRTSSSRVLRPRRPAWDLRFAQGGSVPRFGRTADVASREAPAGLGAAGAVGAAAWRRRGIDLPAHLTSSPRSAWRNHRVADVPREAPQVAPPLTSIPPAMGTIPPAMGTIPPALGGGERRAFGTARFGSGSGEANGDAGWRRLPGVTDAPRRYLPRSRSPVVVAPSQPAGGEPAQATTDTTPPASVLLPPSPANATSRFGRSSWRRVSQGETSVEPRVLPAPVTVPTPSRAPFFERRSLPAVVPDVGAAGDAGSAGAADAGGSRFFRRSAPRVERPATVETPSAPSDAGRSGGSADRGWRRFGSLGDAPPPPSHGHRR